MIVTERAKVPPTGWAGIAQLLPGRPDMHIKNHWRSLKKRVPGDSVRVDFLQLSVNSQKARVARAMEPHYEAFGVLNKPRAGQQNQLKTEIYDSWMRWIEEQEQGDLTTKDMSAELLKIAKRVMSAAAAATELTRKAQ